MLSNEQSKVANHSIGHARVAAVAGAGKTTTMIELIINLINSGVPAERIRTVLFNKSASDDFSSRLQSKCAKAGIPTPPPVRTFHSIGRSLCVSMMKMGFLEQGDVNPISDIKLNIMLMESLLAVSSKDLRTVINKNKREWGSALYDFTDIVKNSNISPTAAFEQYKFPQNMDVLIEAFYNFEAKRIKQGNYTYADYLYQPWKVLSESEEAKNSFANKVDVFVVDEFQDLNDIQFDLLSFLAGTRARIIVVGDSDQNIYEFRGSKCSHMTHGFGERYEHTTYLIPRTFRYGHSLALAAGNLISNNNERDDVLCIAGDGAPRTTIGLHGQSPDCEEIGDLCKAKIKRGYAEDDIAILCRLWSQSAPIELCLLRHGLHYKVLGGKPALERDEIQALIVILRLYSGSWDREAVAVKADLLFRLLKQLDLKAKHAALKGIADKLSIISAASLPEILVEESSSLNIYQKIRITEVAETLDFVSKSDNASVALERFVMALDYIEKLRQSGFDEADGEAKATAAEAFIKFININPDDSNDMAFRRVSKLIEISKSGDGSGITITTMHRSKGLEWPCVMIPGMSAEMMPCLKNQKEYGIQTTVEAERRLLYVGMTRAKASVEFFAPGLYLNEPVETRPEKNQTPSYFLSEMRLFDSIRVGSSIEGNNSIVSLQCGAGGVFSRYIRAIGKAGAIEIQIGGRDFSKCSPGEVLLDKEGNEWFVIDADVLGILIKSRSGESRFYSNIEASTKFSARHKAAATADTKEIPDKCRIEHSKFGTGFVKGGDENYIVVKFEDKERTFRRESFVSCYLTDL